MEENLVNLAGLPFDCISAAALRGKNPLAIIGALWSLIRGFGQARRLLISFEPDVLFVTGGYVCGPVTVAAWFLGVPVLIYLPDIEPGLAIKWLSRLSQRVAVTTEKSKTFFRPGQAVVTGYPVRDEIFSRSATEARRRLNLVDRKDTPGRNDGPGWKEMTGDAEAPDQRPILLVFGGSQGARSINRAVCDGIRELLSAAEVIHVAGQLDIEWVRAIQEELPEKMRAHYHTYDYLHNQMVDALLAADLTVGRAGASTLGELPAAGLPAVLVPYPYAGAHQWQNARYLVDVGAAVAVDDADLETELMPMVLSLLSDEKRRDAMSWAARKLAQPDAAERIARELGELAR